MPREFGGFLITLKKLKLAQNYKNVIKMDFYLLHQTTYKYHDKILYETAYIKASRQK